MSAVPQTKSPILSISNIEVIYDHVILVLRGVSLEVQEGQIVALLGANGAGKTTTLKAISNLLRAEQRDDLSLLHLERHAAQHKDDVVVDDLDVADRKDRAVGRHKKGRPKAARGSP